MKKVLLTFLIALTISAPSLAFAQAPKLDYSGFVKCDGIVKREDRPDYEPDRQRECNFAALMDTIIKLINWLFRITIPVATVLFAYGGLLYMTGEKGKIDTAKKIFSSVAVGFIIMVVAWFAVRTVVNWFIDPDFKGADTLVK